MFNWRLASKIDYVGWRLVRQNKTSDLISISMYCVVGVIVTSINIMTTRIIAGGQLPDHTVSFVHSVVWKRNSVQEEFEDTKEIIRIR